MRNSQIDAMSLLSQAANKAPMSGISVLLIEQKDSSSLRYFLILFWQAREWLRTKRQPSG